MNILVKFPTRARGPHFLKVLKRYVDTLKLPESVHFLISYDHDDETMTDEVVEKAKQIAGPQNITLVKGVSYNKIHACNRDVNEYAEHWDIIMLASDDMIPQFHGWDVAIIKAMVDNYPDTDGCLWFNDGRQPRICTFSIMGRAYYERRNYLYHPSYKSLWCDNEFTDVARLDGKMRYYPTVLFKNESPDWGGNIPTDGLYARNNKFFAIDKRNYEMRKQKKFPK